MLLWGVMALSVAYVLFFALASHLPQRPSQLSPSATRASRHASFLVLIPAYAEDAVICATVESFLRQDYPRDRFRLVVISDHQADGTNRWLARQPITLLIPDFDHSTKARALRFALHQVKQSMDYVVILDADNLVAPDFLSQLDAECQEGHAAIQCHRTAKNADSDIAVLDGLSEEINNSVFRLGHNRLGLSSALIGSGMCMEYGWLAGHADGLATAGEDKELEAMLLWERRHIHYAERILVEDEKVCRSDNFQRQRLRWLTAQVQALRAMLPRVPRAVATARIDYIDKALQQVLLPRSILLVVISAMAVLISSLSLLIPQLSPLTSLKWWILLLALLSALLTATPRRLRTRAVLSSVAVMPSLALRMVGNLLHIRPGSNDFIHTTHGK